MRAAAPPFGASFIGAAFWALAMGASAAQALHAEGWQIADKARELLFIYCAGAFVSFPASLYAARLLSLGRPRNVAFAAFALALGCLTIGFTAAFYALDYRVYYTQWHAEPFTRTWMFQFGFTIAGALYQFAVLGLRLYMPFGPIALLFAAWWFARHPR